MAGWLQRRECHKPGAKPTCCSGAINEAIKANTTASQLLPSAGWKKCGVLSSKHHQVDIFPLQFDDSMTPHKAQLATAQPKVTLADFLPCQKEGISAVPVTGRLVTQGLILDLVRGDRAAAGCACA